MSVYIELPEIGRHVEKGEASALVETVKSVRDVHAPVGGVVTSVNDTVFDDPDMISRQPLETWLLKLRTDDDDRRNLMTKSQYAAWTSHKKKRYPNCFGNMIMRWGCSRAGLTPCLFRPDNPVRGSFALSMQMIV